MRRYTSAVVNTVSRDKEVLMKDGSCIHCEYYRDYFGHRCCCYDKEKNNGYIVDLNQIEPPPPTCGKEKDDRQDNP